eukprot:scaffold285103_cov23-Tisochrysis_lutea.AAC.3
MAIAPAVRPVGWAPARLAAAAAAAAAWSGHALCSIWKACPNHRGGYPPTRRYPRGSCSHRQRGWHPSARCPGTPHARLRGRAPESALERRQPRRATPQPSPPPVQAWPRPSPLPVSPVLRPSQPHRATCRPPTGARPLAQQQRRALGPEQSQGWNSSPPPRAAAGSSCPAAHAAPPACAPILRLGLR